MLLIILLSNIFFFIPLTYKIFHSGGGPFGFGVMLLPFQLLAHLFIIPAVLALKKRGDKSNFSMDKWDWSS